MEKENFPLIPYINKVHTDSELLICGEPYNVLPHIFDDNYFTDDDLIYESDQTFRDQKVIYRCHPLRASRMGISWEETPNDPLSSILRAKRVTSVSSQMLLKSMLWNKPTICLKDTLPFSFKCEKNLETLKTVDLLFINLLILLFDSNSFFFSKSTGYGEVRWPRFGSNIHKHLKYYSYNIGIDLENHDKIRSTRNIKRSATCERVL